MEQLGVKVQKHLNTLLREFKNCKSKKKYIELINIYYIIDDLIKNTNINIKYSKEFEYELNKYPIDKYDKLYELKFLDNYDLMYNYNIELSSIYKHLNRYFDNSIEYQNTVELNETINNVQSFFKTFNKDIYNYFNKQILDNGLLVLSNKIDDGRTYLSNYIFPPYSLMNPKLCARDYVVVVHETIHSYIRNRLRYINFDQLNTMLVNNLEEVFPIFTELCAIEYAQENNVLPELSKYKKAMYISLYKYLESYNKNLLNNEIINYVNNERYAYGYLLAYQYYSLYNIDREYAKEKVLNFSLASPYHEKKVLLNNYGINQFDLLNTSRCINNIK